MPQIQLPKPIRSARPPSALIEHGGRLGRMLRAIEGATRAASHDRDRVVAAALAPFLGVPDLLEGVACPCTKERYTRHILHGGADYSVLALVWRPGQMSPVHGHRTWCAFGIHRGWMTETFFSAGGAQPVSCVARRKGDLSHSPADPDAIHRLANLGTETALSIHVYGVRPGKLGAEVNQVWAD